MTRASLSKLALPAFLLCFLFIALTTFFATGLTSAQLILGENTVRVLIHFSEFLLVFFVEFRFCDFSVFVGVHLIHHVIMSVMAFISATHHATFGFFVPARFVISVTTGNKKDYRNKTQHDFHICPPRLILENHLNRLFNESKNKW